MAKSATSPVVETEIHDGVAIVALNRPEVRNAVNLELRAALDDAVEKVEGDNDVRAVVLTGRGPGFCAGGDIKAMGDRFNLPPGETAMHGIQVMRDVHETVMRLHNLPKPTVAAVNGGAAGLGFDLALACDFIVAADSAVFIMSYVLRGLIPDGGGLYFLPRRVGLARAKELIFSGRRVEANEALQIGLADAIVPADALIGEATALAGRMAAFPGSVALSKAILNKSFELPLADILALTGQAQAICYTTDEHRNAVREFLESRKK